MSWRKTDPRTAGQPREEGQEVLGKCLHGSNWSCPSVCAAGAPTPTQLCESKVLLFFVSGSRAGQLCFRACGWGGTSSTLLAPLAWDEESLFLPLKRAARQQAHTTPVTVFTEAVIFTNPHLTSV